MEDILASIRRIIAEEGDGAEAEGSRSGGDDVLELTEVVGEDGAADAVIEPAAVEPERDAPAEDPEPALQPSVNEPEITADRLVSQAAASLAANRFSSLARAAEPDPLAGVRGGRTVEEVCIDLLKPMLKDWLDANLPGIVERLVEREIRYLSRRPESE
ncbi:MAG: DUF2497 domain-containing protein [Alphaproteobacteria bacterium]